MSINLNHQTNSIVTTGNVLSVTGNVSANNLVTSGSLASQSIRIAQITANAYTLQPSDSGVTLVFSNANAITVNVNSNLNIGFRTMLTQVNTGAVTIVAGNNVTLNPRTGSFNQISSIYGSASIFCYASNTFILDGALQ